MVANLIDQEGGGWKEDTVNECLLPFEAKEVLAMPLPSISVGDELVWSYKMSGEYSVKSGYNFINLYKGTQDVGGQPSNVSKLWHWIWGLAVPTKVRVFMWRLCNGALPTAAGLHRRIDSIDPLCQRCGNMEETSLHTVWGCSFLSGLWELEELRCMWDCPNMGDVRDWVNWWLSRLKREEASKVAMVCWMGWNERNNTLHGKQARL